MTEREMKNIIKILLVFQGLFYTHIIRIDEFDKFLENIDLDNDISTIDLKNKIIEKLSVMEK